MGLLSAVKAAYNIVSVCTTAPLLTLLWLAQAHTSCTMVEQKHKCYPACVNIKHPVVRLYHETVFARTPLPLHVSMQVQGISIVQSSAANTSSPLISYEGMHDITAPDCSAVLRTHCLLCYVQWFPGAAAANAHNCAVTHGSPDSCWVADQAGEAGLRSLQAAAQSI